MNRHNRRALGLAKPEPRNVRAELAGLFVWIGFYFNASADYIRGELEDVATRRVVELAKPRTDDAGRLVRLECARNGCPTTIDVPDDEHRAAAQLNIRGWITTDDDRLVCPRCVPKAMRAGLA